MLKELIRSVAKGTRVQGLLSTHVILLHGPGKHQSTDVDLVIDAQISHANAADEAGNIFWKHLKFENPI